MLYIIGHSHALNPLHALSASPIGINHRNWDDDGFSFTFEPLTPRPEFGITAPVRYQIMNPKKGVSANYSSDAKGVTINVTASFAEIIKHIENAPSHCLLCFISGNEHSSLSMIEHNVPYDFMRPGDGPSVNPGNQIIPLAIIREQIGNTTLEFRALTDALRVALPQVRIYIFSPPPPIPSVAQIKSSPEVFRETLKTRKITDISIRFKYYQEYIVFIKKQASRIGAHFIAPPPETCTAEGYLSEGYWEGATHGNMAYAERVALQISALCK